MRRVDEKPPENHWKRRFPEHEKLLMDTYYKYKGWTMDGIPTRETLHKYGLHDVIEDFLARGIFTKDDDSATQKTPENEPSEKKTSEKMPH